MRIACFNPDLQDVEGCSPTSDLAQEQKRFKRVNLEFNSHSILAYMYKLSRGWQRTLFLYKISKSHDFNSDFMILTMIS